MTARRRLRAGATAAAAIAVLAVAAWTSQSSPGTGGARARSRGTAAAVQRSRPVSFVVELRADDRGLRRYATDVNDPASPLYGRVLSSAAVGRRFGAPASGIRRVRRILERAGLHVGGPGPLRMALDVRGSPDDVGRAFGVPFRRSARAGGAAYFAPAGDATVPRALRPWVSALLGLDGRPRLSPADVRGGVLGPGDAALAYDLGPLHARAVDGRGETIAILSFSSYRLTDAAVFARQFHLRGPQPEVISVAGGAGDAGIIEASLDLDVVRGIAPGAQVLFYEAPNNDLGELRMLDAIVRGPATIVSDSWGLCDEPSAYRDPARRLHRLAVERRLEQAVVEGKTFFVASGDAGSYDCQRHAFANHRLTVDFPSDSPFAVSVGGTVLNVRPDGRYYSEAGWENALTNAGGGGGVNPFSRKPSWQRSYGAGRGTSNRAVPDVSAAASWVGSPWWVRADGSWWAIGGTSAAAPFWAASMVLVEQWAERQGAGRMCFAAPVLYGTSARERRFRPFHDVRAGGNRHYRAGPGWDYATGLGSPDVWNLARAVTAYLKGHRAACETSSKS